MMFCIWMVTSILSHSLAFVMQVLVWWIAYFKLESIVIHLWPRSLHLQFQYSMYGSTTPVPVNGVSLSLSVLWRAPKPLGLPLMCRTHFNRASHACFLYRPLAILMKTHNEHAKCTITHMHASKRHRTHTHTNKAQSHRMCISNDKRAREVAATVPPTTTMWQCHKHPR